MVKTLSLTTDVPLNRELRITLPGDVPVGPAEIVLVVLPQNRPSAHTLGELGTSAFIGMWQDREDIEDSVDFARRLREEAWSRPK
jgi:hypothetical protein